MKDLNEIKTVLPYHLQFFAEPPLDAPLTPPSEPGTPPVAPPLIVPVVTPPITPPIEPTLSVEEQLAKLMGENKRLKDATTKATAEAAENKRLLRAKMSESEKYDLEKAEREAEFQTRFKQLERENSINKMSKSFIGMGYSEDQAVKAASAQLEGDYDELFRIQNTFLTARDKQKESEWMKKAPTPPAGNQDNPPEDLFLKGFNR